MFLVSFQTIVTSIKELGDICLKELDKKSNNSLTLMVDSTSLVSSNQILESMCKNKTKRRVYFNERAYECKRFVGIQADSFISSEWYHFVFSLFSLCFC